MSDYHDERIELNHLHPYEYLTSLNSVFASCNKANSKSTSSYSKLKLAWKPFSIMKIPNVSMLLSQCFEATYTQKAHKMKVSKVELNAAMDENERKMWKEHQEILKRHKNKENKNQYDRPRTANRKNYN